MEFTKIHGLGNDYIYINLLTGKNQIAEKDIPKVSRFMSNRHFGVGADGIILIEKSKLADFKMRIFNQDGSEAEMCGNGIRGFAKYVYDNKLTTKKEIKIETLAGIKNVKVYTQANGKVQTAQVNMGKASFAKNKDIIINENEKDKENINTQKTIKNYENEKNNTIKLEYIINGKKYTGTYISIGNPHFVIFEKNIEELNLELIGKTIENDSHFPNRVNVEIAQIQDLGNIKMRVWERGSGETFSCGTGACAVTKAAYSYGLTRNAVKVHLKGGVLDIRINKLTDEIYMTGMTNKVFDGKIENELVGII